MNLTTVTIRDVTRNYKQIFTNVKTKGKRAIVMNDREPEVAIISLEDLKRLETVDRKAGIRKLLDMAGIFPKGSGLPADLSERHDDYTWS